MVFICRRIAYEQRNPLKVLPPPLFYLQLCGQTDDDIRDRISSNDGEEDEDDHQSQHHLIQPHLTTLVIVIPFLSQPTKIVAPSQERF